MPVSMPFGQHTPPDSPHSTCMLDAQLSTTPASCSRCCICQSCRFAYVLLLAIPFRKQMTDSCCTHTQTGGYVQDRWHDANALHEQRHDSPQRGAHGVCFSLCIVCGVAVPALTFIITLLLQFLWCSVVKCLQHLVLSIHRLPSCCL